MSQILTVTLNPALDVHSHIQCLAPGEKMRTTSSCFLPGGGGVNVSRAIQSLNGKSRCFYLKGGPVGSYLELLMDDIGLEQHYVPIQDNNRHHFNVLDESTGQHYRFGMPGPCVSPDEMTATLNYFHNLQDVYGSIAVLSGSIPSGLPHDFYARITRILKAKNMKVVVDAKGSALKAAVREGAYLFKMNLDEFSQLADFDPEDISSIIRAGKNFVRQHDVQKVILSMSDKGAIGICGDESMFIRVPETIGHHVVGSGDSMVAGIVMNLGCQMSTQDGLMYGVAAGTSCALSPMDELCRRDRTEEFFKSIQSNYFFVKT
ncbi:MAG: 1-phosphofructokinase family hexose kinase [Candidatus Omnitrophica bacterium]|nr:1-phosphofructokinase family hexose kinase [Candidatus Omnitrophota bacterium]